jgi:predicted metal-dependent peptidase
MEPDEMMRKARWELLSKHPFYGYIALNLDLKADEKLPDHEPVTTNGKHLLYRPDLVGAIPMQELAARIAHASDHLALGHMLPSRVREKDQKIWNLASDIVINRGLAREFYGGNMPANWIRREMFQLGPECDTMFEEELYEKLADMMKQQQQGGQGNDKSDGPAGCGMQQQDDGDDDADGEGGHDEDGEHDHGTGSAFANQAEAEQQLREAMENAQMYAKMIGSDPYKLHYGVDIDKVLHPPLNWKAMLRRFVASVRGGSGTDWVHPNKRYDFYWPSRHGTILPKILFLVDSSGSVDNEMYAEFIMEGTKAEKYCEPEIAIFDTKVEEVHKQFSKIAKRNFAGGTRVQPGFQLIKNHKAVVVLTDGELGDWDPKPSIPVLWVIANRYHQNVTVPYGSVTHMAIKGS